VIDRNETESLNLSQLHLSNRLSNGKIPRLPGVLCKSLVLLAYTLGCFLGQLPLGQLTIGHSIF
jgi:hypothetical protein